MTSRSILSSPARLGALLAALALFVRVLVPAGFMPMASAGGMPTLMMCSGQGPIVMPKPMSMAMPGMDHHGQQHDGDAGDHACPFGALTGAVDIAAPFAPALMPFVAVAQLIAISVSARPGLGLAAPPPPKTGPPILA